jgi:hypothetical protein
MSESGGRDTQRDPRARRLLALHAEHREGLHRVPVPDCIQCTFDGLVRPNGDETITLSDPDGP